MFDHFTPAMLDLFASSLWETLIMVGISGLVGGLLGVPLGVFLRLTDDGGVLENGPVNKLVGWLVTAAKPGSAQTPLPGIVAGLTITFVSLTGYSAMAGAIGGGGLGDLGIRYGYQRFLPEIMLAVVLVLIFFVQAVQSLGDWAVRKLSHR